ncbi:hypothetical protein LTR33_002384, partial [Friedmanniomyces endolithicus]
HFRAVLAFKPKENAVKQELEKLAEEQKAVVKVSVGFNKGLSSGGLTKVWRDYFEFVRKEFAQGVKAAEEELKGSAEY